MLELKETLFKYELPIILSLEIVYRFCALLLEVKKHDVGELAFGKGVIYVRKDELHEEHSV
jgi:hypothetical protein